MKSTDSGTKATLVYQTNWNRPQDKDSVWKLRYRAKAPKKCVTTKIAKAIYWAANDLMLSRVIDGWWVYEDGWIFEVNGIRTETMTIDAAGALVASLMVSSMMKVAS